MFSIHELRSDFGPERKAKHLKRLRALQDETDYCTGSKKAIGPMIPIGIYDGDPPPEDLSFRNLDDEK